MPLFNFKKQFADAVENRIKRQTIRAHRTDGSDPQEGQIAHCYTGLRTPKTKLLGRWPITSVENIRISGNGVALWLDADCEVTIDDKESLDLFAQDDGFADWPAMRAWFRDAYGLPFDGVLSKW